MRATAHQSRRSTISALLEIGMPVQLWNSPAELREARPAGPALTLDDVLDFHLLLQCEDSFEVLLRSANSLDPRR
jgi:hypothetical protein